MIDALEAWQKETKDLWLWRDGTAVTRYSSSRYAREGLKIPDRWDFDAQKPQTLTEKSVVLLEMCYTCKIYLHVLNNLK
jgi:hypothetical protein